ncbi:MAG: SulP family inorganic anion transporter [Desulfobacterales bacterium]|nr:SulP family inorganic anion transporter [Desulfobacterales bacterium]
MPLNRKNLISDLAAGFTTGLFRIPKGMAYAKLLGVNPVYGLYSIMAAPIVASLATGTILMVSTLTIAIAICTGSVIQQAGIDVATHPSALITITFLAGAVMGQGYLTYDLDWLAAGPSQKVFRIWNPPQAADQIECAVVPFDFQKGVAASRVFMFDTRAGITVGEGEINRGNEKIDFFTGIQIQASRPAPRVQAENKRHDHGTPGGCGQAPLLTRSAEGLSALAVGPIGLLAPFPHLDAYRAYPCDVNGIWQRTIDIPAKEQAPSPSIRSREKAD